MTGAKLDQNDHDWQYGARLGVMFEPSATTRIGAVWTMRRRSEKPMALVEVKAGK